MKHLHYIGVAVAVAAALASAAFGANKNFSGTWVLDTARSTGLPPGVTQTVTVKHEGDRLEADVQMHTERGDETYHDAYVIDGKETAITPFAPAGVQVTGKRTSRWSESGAMEATEHDVFQGPQGPVEVTITRAWTIADDGKTLTVDQTIEGGMGSQHVVRVFARK